MHLVWDTVANDGTVALATVAVKDRGQAVFVLEVLQDAFEPRGVKWDRTGYEVRNRRRCAD